MTKKGVFFTAFVGDFCKVSIGDKIAKKWLWEWIIIDKKPNL